MSSILYGMIHQRAIDSYSGPDINAANYKLWTDHWFKTAEKIMVEFAGENLLATAEAVRVIIIENRKYCK